MARSKNAAIGFIFVTLLIDVTGFGIIIPVIPKLISEMLHIPVNEASKYGGWLTAAYAVMQFVFAPALGNLSDKYGRRPVLLFSLFGFGVDYLVTALAPSFGWLFLGRIFAGITGASFSTASAYIADVSTPETRAKNFGMIGAAFGLGFIIGPLLGGLLGELGTRVPFYAAAGLALLNWLYGYFILPESLPPEKRRAFNWKTIIPGVSLIKLKKYPSIVGLFFSFFFISLAAHAVQSNWSFYTIYVFNWSEGMVGISLTVVGVLIGLVQGLLIRVINPKLGNEKSVFIGLILYSVGMLLFGMANQGWMMFVFLIPYCLGGIAGPAIQAIMAKHVPSNEQGELQGSLTSTMSLTSIFGPVLMTGLFTSFTQAKGFWHIPGMPFFAGAFFMFTSAALAWWVLRNDKQQVVQA